jgi:hypothetical protein
MPAAKQTVPALRTREQAGLMALLLVEAEETVGRLKIELQGKLDGLRESYTKAIDDARKRVKGGLSALERWAAGDLPNWAGKRSLVFDNGIELAFALDPIHVVPTPQQRADRPIITAILGPAEAGDGEDVAEAETLLAGLGLAPADHARLRRRYLTVAWSLDRDAIRILYAETVTASGAADRQILTALGLGVEQGETFRVGRAERQPSEPQL